MYPSHANCPEWLHWLDTCPSTNTWAMAHLNDLKHGDVVFTQRQTAGRGQHGRTWHSPPGVLTASVILDRICGVHLPKLSLVAGLAVIYALEDLVPALSEKLQIKWPNDVLWKGRKLAGLLCEASTASAVSRVVVGVGLNRCAESAPALGTVLPRHAISLHQVCQTVPNELLLLDRLRHYLLEAAGLLRFETSSASSGFLALLPALRCRDALMGQQLTLDLGQTQVLGQAAGISDQGHLRLRLPHGQIQSFSSGHILYQSIGD